MLDAGPAEGQRRGEEGQGREGGGAGGATNGGGRDHGAAWRLGGTRAMATSGQVRGESYLEQFMQPL